MQEDIVDATRWLIRKGVADKNRICIVGESFGGYSALMILAKEPDMYKCGIAFAGVYDLTSFVQSKRFYTSSKFWEKRIGLNGAALKNASPINFVSAIKAPVLLAHGEQDRVVNFKESREMARALKLANKEYQFLSLKDGTHYLNKQSNRTVFFNAMEDFLARNLPVN